ncbi:MAG: protein kinase [Pirellulaceae bacterium]|nr:protein kinase [Pirellulaceae bacterium]
MNDDDDDWMPADDTDDSDTDIRDPGERDTQTSDSRARRLPAPFKPGQLCGEFQIERLLGQGSSGCVFRAFDTVSRRSCALKVLTCQKPANLRRNRIGFRRMMELRHPNLMRVDQMHQIEDHVALSMEEIQGETLTKTRRRYRKLEIHLACTKLLSLTRDYAAALAAMHDRGLLHRDIKPSNLMVDRNERGRVIDYGLVGTFDAELNSQGFRDYFAGTFRYMSPEAYYDQRHTPAGDIYSLGLVVLEFLNSILGRRDWSRDDQDRDQDAQLIHSAVDGLVGSNPSLLTEACTEMLQVNPGDRPTAVQLARLGLPTGKSTIYMGGKPMFGRDDEFATACDWLNSVYRGNEGRLHIYGPSGIGKSGLVDAIERHLKSLRWGQVFRAQCRPRETHPMQAFDQIATEIATRYASNDRTPLRVDPASANILHDAFPVLKEVVLPSKRQPFARTGDDRIDALYAACHLSVELRKVGPLILIVDDVQWADPDTHGILDALQKVGGGMLGIITVSRYEKSAQRLPPDLTIQLKPLSDKVSRQMLGEAARRWSVNLSEETLQELSELAGGNPFRLSELEDELRPGGLLHNTDADSDSSISSLGSVDRLWKHRAENLSADARRILPLIATAACPVSMGQLALVSDLGDDVEIAVSELASQRLVIDDATSGRCIRMVHDRICEGVIAELSDAECKFANLAWSDLLKGESESEKVAGRIARHLLDAGQTAEAVEYAKAAASESEMSFAFGEAAQWHERVEALTESTDEKVVHLIQAARLFIQGDQPIRAAQQYEKLAKASKSEDQRLEYRIAATQLLIRAGRFDQSRASLNELATSLGLPKPDRALGWLASARQRFQLQRMKLELPRLDNHQTASSAPSRRDELRLSLCQNLVRPLLMFHPTYASELFASLAKQVQRIGSSEDQTAIAIASATIACCDLGQRRTQGETLLRDLQATATDLGPKTTGDYWSGKAMTQLMALNWSAVNKSVEASVQAYTSDGSSHPFEVGNTRWMGLWADWYRGLWTQMRKSTDAILVDSSQRDDRIEHFVTTTGLASATWLGRDAIDDLTRRDEHNQECFVDPGPIAEWFAFLADVQRSLYNGEFQQAFDRCQQFERVLTKSTLSGIQVARILVRQFGALSALQLLQSDPRSKWRLAAQNCIDHLQREKLPCALVLADLYAGILLRLIGDDDGSRKKTVAAQQLATELDLMPFQLAAEDNLDQLRSGERIGLLSHRMQNQGIVRPGQFERLYTVPPRDDASS